jgi:hypothetical protein
MVEKSPAAQQRHKRLARELRENLKRRKAQTRARAQRVAQGSAQRQAPAGRSAPDRQDG